ncbi:ATP-binding protein [uncultured Algibacter sp.]|uniref:hybrid sensor histidine kinase/response regulator transcription factor n=1 Tax=uncultured Algibacter sp. TaxID=298659 RepID=UPI0032164DF1
MIKTLRQILFLFIFLFANSYHVCAQQCTLKPNKQFSTVDGLSHNGVTSLFEDSYGFIWVGTYDGLNKYDGYSFKKYRNTLKDNLLLSNRITSLNEDSNKKLWIGTESGINILDLKTDKVSVLYTNEIVNTKSSTVKKIIFGNNADVICLLENHTVLHFVDYKLVGVFKPKDKAFKTILFRDILKINKNEYAISTSIGLMVFNLTTKIFKLPLKGSIGPCFGLLIVNNQDLLIAKSHGIAHLKYNNGIHYIKTSLKNNRYKYMALDKNNTMWLGAVSGINHIHDFSIKALHKDLIVCDARSPSKEIYVSSISTNVKNRCWVTTYNAGIYQFGIFDNPFNSYDKNIGLPYGIETNNIIDLTHYKDNQVFISTYFGKTCLFDIEKKVFLPLPFKDPPLGNNYKGVIIKDSKDNILFSPRGIQMGLYRKKITEETFKHIKSDSFPIINNAQIKFLVEDRQGYIWAADRDDVYRIKFDDFNNKPIVESLNNAISFKPKLASIGYIYVDPKYDFIWLGSKTNGLYRLDTKGVNSLHDIDVKNYQPSDVNSSISSNYVSHIMRDRESNLWIATDQGGISHVTNENTIPKFVTYSEKDGLINNGAKRIEFDSDNNLWISTNVGINKFNTTTKEFIKYQKDDGLPFLQFEFSSVKLPNGTLVFGGRDGLVYFNPEDIKQTNEAPRLEFGEFKLFNKTIKPGDKVQNKVLLEKNLSLLDKIELNYNQNVFSIEVISLHFKSKNNHFIKYRLSPLDKDWIIKPSSKNTIQYNGLPPGNYNLEVMASNSDNIWSPSKQLNIKIVSHILNTKFAYIIYGVFSLIVIGLIIKWAIRYYKLQLTLNIKQLEKEQEIRLSDIKLRFFTNISHEFRTPLTLINGPLEVFLDKFKKDKSIVDYLSLVKRQSNKILQLVEQAHDFRKAEKDMLELYETRFNFSSFIKQLILDFEYLAESKEKHLVLKNPEDDVFILADKNKLEKVLNNLINNAFKFTDKGDTITINYKLEETEFTCTVTDSGRGIDAEDLPHVFERFYQSKNDYLTHFGGSGIGLAFSKKLILLHGGDITVESNVNNGTSFTFKIPIEKIETEDIKAYKFNQIIAEAVEQDHSLLPIEENTDVTTIDIEDSLRRSQIFIVEDNDEMRIFLMNIFSEYFKVSTFSNGKECVDALQNEWPDLIVSDVMMPVMNGIELCENVKNNISTSHIPFILLTAVSTMESKLKSLGVGADAYINKPFQVKHLVIQSITLLKSRKRLRERFQIDFPQNIEKNLENDNEHAFIEKLFEMIDKNIHDPNFDVNFLARELYISRSNFFQKVKALTNQTPYELIKEYRLKKAAEMLVKSNVQVSEVYSNVGFKSMSHFSRAFKNKYGVTPGKFKLEE